MKKKTLLDQLLAPQDQQRLLEKIKQIENRSSGEVRLHITDKRVKDTMKAARKTFTDLEMTRTRRRNGVLVFLSLPSRTFAIVGDEGIDRLTGPQYWENLRDTMAERFSAGSYADGLLDIFDQVEAVLNQELHQVMDGQLRGIWLNGEHGFPKKYFSQGDAVEPPHQLLFIINLYRICEPQRMQIAVCPDKVIRDPCAFLIVSCDS